jgi:hypothetical protein
MGEDFLFFFFFFFLHREKGGKKEAHEVVGAKLSYQETKMIIKK